MPDLDDRWRCNFGPVAGAACLVSAALYVLYPERQVLLAAREDGA